MSKVLVEEGNLTNIANAIRTKGNTTAVYKPSEMAAAISNLSTSTSTYVPTDEDLTFTDCQSTRLFANNQFSWIFKNYKDKKIRFTGNCRNLESTFYQSKVDDLSNVIFENCYGSGNYGANFSSMLTEAITKYSPEIKNCDIGSLKSAFQGARNLETIPSFENCTIADESDATVFSSIFYEARSLKNINFDLGKNARLREKRYYYWYYYTFCDCWNLRSIEFSMPMIQESPIINNQFRSFVVDCWRLRHLKFKNYLPSLQMKSQIIEMAYRLGYSNDETIGLRYSNLFPEGKRIKDDATYQALKDDPDAWTTKPEYALYNHDSAVETINSLPDTSAYLAENGGTNTIKFLGNAGSNTDGGAINTMTAEEIAVATAKGWTVTFE